MKNAIKKIVSAVASVVLGFNMITAPQVFAENGSTDDVILNEEYRSRNISISATSQCLAIVPDNDESTCVQSMASDGTYIYVTKIHIIRDKKDKKKVIGYDKASIYRFDPKTKEEPKLIKNTNGKKYSDFGHAGDMTAVKYGKYTYLLVLEKADVAKKSNYSTYTLKKYTYVHILKVDNTNNQYEELRGPMIELEIGSISADFVDAKDVGENTKHLYFRSGHKLYKGSINMKNTVFTIEPKPIKLDFNVGSLQSQGMCHYRSNDYNQLYIVYSYDKNAKGKKRKENIIIEYNLDGKKKGEVNYDYITTNSSKIDELELEGCAIIGTTVYCCTNCQNGSTTYDGIYKTNC